MPVDFTNIKTTRNRGYRPEMISRLNDSLRHVPIMQRAAILGSIIEESGGDPLAKSDDSTFQGFLQWGKDRYRIQSNNREDEFERQLAKLLTIPSDTANQKDWTHGGIGSGYESFRDAYADYTGSDKSLEQVFRGFDYGYVRPAGKEDSYDNRMKVVQQVYDRLLEDQKRPEILPASYDEKSTSFKPPVHIEYTDAIQVPKRTEPQPSQKHTRESVKKAMEDKVNFHKFMNSISIQNNPRPQFEPKYKFSEGGTINHWNNLSIADKAAMMEVAIKNGITTLPEIRKAYNEFAEGGDISDENYYSIMERVAKENWQKWGDPSEDAALTRILNSNDYDYRGYYNKYPESKANADTHWTDEFKTRWHPTFSVESKYSGEKSEYNPEGYVGGMWLEDAFIPQAWQVDEQNRKEEENLFDKGGTKKQAFLTSLDRSLKEDSRFDNAEWRQFFTDLANMESGYSSNVTNSIGAKGYFQLMPFNRAKTWNNPTQQFHEMYKLTGNNLNYLNKNLTKKDWEKADALGIDMYGMLAGAHLGGAGNVLKALRGKGNAKDMNGTSVMNYMTKFSQKGARPVVTTPSYYDDTSTISFAPSNPDVFFGGYKAPEIDAPLPLVGLDDTPQYSEEEIARQERKERLNNLNMLFKLTSPQGSSNSMLDAIGLLMG